MTFWNFLEEEQFLPAFDDVVEYFHFVLVSCYLILYLEDFVISVVVWFDRVQMNLLLN